MKNMIKLSFALLAGILAFASCSKNNYDYEAEIEKERIADSLENARTKKIIAEQAGTLRSYVESHEELSGAQFNEDSGIWFKVLAAGDENSYTYKFNSNGYVTAPTVTVKYKGQLLNGTVFDQTTADKTATFGLSGVISAWHIAFLPKEITYNGTNYQTGGLIANGLKKGSKIRFVTPSPWAYDTSEKKDASGNVTIPANSPLDFTIEVVEIY